MAATKTDALFVREFAHDRETKGTQRFAEVEGDGATAVGTLYIRKDALGGANPARLRVTVEVVQ